MTVMTAPLQPMVLPSRPPAPAEVHGEAPVARVSRLAREAWDMTVLSSVPKSVTAPILEHAVETRVKAGETLYRGARHAETALLGVVVDGLLRFYLHSPDGRSMTVRYAARGELVGVRGLALAHGPSPSTSPYGGASLNGDALQDSVLLLLPRAEVVAVARRHPELAWALSREIAEQAMQDQEMMATNVFSPIQARVARHLLMLARRDGDELVFRASHQEIADSIGSVREVVSRALCRFQYKALVERRGRCLILRDPARLHAASLG